ncbi:MAG: hypothetical protein NTY96_01200 [Bacteroidetes bacterium]|nr:hypothetical protein [Bacteroidota bacterium]
MEAKRLDHAELCNKKRILPKLLGFQLILFLDRILISRPDDIPAVM